MESSKIPAAGTPVAVVTGATSGIGREAAIALARKGFRTAVIGRGAERAARAAREIGAAVPTARVDGFGVTDLARMSDVRRLASELQTQYPRIDLLVNNAGALFAGRSLTDERVERTFALNVLSPFLLTSLLLPTLRASPRGRVVNVSSDAHYRQHVDFDDLQLARDYRGFRAYGRSKLELLLLTREFARRLEGTGICVNAVHPGLIHSTFGQNNPGMYGRAFHLLTGVFGRSPRKGAEAILFVATDPGVGDVTGAYFSHHRVAPGSEPSRRTADASRLYRICCTLTGAPELPGLDSAAGS